MLDEILYSMPHNTEEKKKSYIELTGKMFPRIVNWKGSPDRTKKEIGGNSVYATRMHLNQQI